MKRHLLFLYGTLKSGQRLNSSYLAHGEAICDAKTFAEYQLFDNHGAFPYMIHAATGLGNIIQGEVWLIDDITLKGIDNLEGTAQNWYKRELVELQDFDIVGVETYIYQGEVRGLPECKDGVWPRAVVAKARVG